MKPWSQRSREEANLFNPAFCCVILSSSTLGYISASKTGLELPLAFMVLPLVLHRDTRESLPSSTRTSMIVWLHQNAEARILYYEHLMALKDHTMESIHFGLLHKWLAFDENGLLICNSKASTINRTMNELGGDAQEINKKAIFIGKWLASVKSPETVLALWGIRP